MVANRENDAQAVAVLFSAGLDSAVLLADAASNGTTVPIYVASGLAWEAAEQSAIDRLLAAPPYRRNVSGLIRLHVDMRDVFPATHWTVCAPPCRRAVAVTAGSAVAAAENC